MNSDYRNLPIDEWISQGQKNGAINLIVVLNTKTTSYEPIYVMPGENLKLKEKQYNTRSYSVFKNYKID